MIEKVTIDALTLTSVSIKRQRFIDVDGTEYPVGDPWRKAYVNDEQGRLAIETEVEEPYKTAILSIWNS